MRAELSVDRAKARGPSYMLAMVRFLALIALLAAFAGTGMTSAAADSLAGLKGEKRALLLFAKSRSDASFDKQLEILRERRPDLAERDLLVLATQGTQDTIPAIGYTALPSGTARDLRERFQPSTKGLTVILIGKDGGEKGRWSQLVEPDEIFALIDAMPMRQREIGEATN